MLYKEGDLVLFNPVFIDQAMPITAQACRETGVGFTIPLRINHAYEIPMKYPYVIEIPGVGTCEFEDKELLPYSPNGVNENDLWE